MFEKFPDYYTQALRIDLISAVRLFELKPEHSPYAAAAERGAFVVSVLQGDIYESVYARLWEQSFDTYAEAKEMFGHLIDQNPDAANLDFVANPSGGSVWEGRTTTPV